MSNDYTDPAFWGSRADGSAKGSGYFGVLKRPDGGVSSELSIGVSMDGKETEIPALVPTLTADEVHHLLWSPAGQAMPPQIVQKAVDFARQRAAQQQPYFAQSGEQSLDAYAQFPRSRVTAPGANLMAPSHGADEGAVSRPDYMGLTLRDLIMQRLKGGK